MEAKRNISQQLLINLLALDGLFKDHEFIHCYMGPARLKREASKIKPEQALENITRLSSRLGDIPDRYPLYRRTFVRDLLQSVTGQVKLFCSDKKPDNMQNIIKSLTGSTVVAPFDLNAELEHVSRYIKTAGSSSIPQFLKARQKIKFDTIKSLEIYVYDYVSQITSKMDAGKLMDDLQLKVEGSKIPHLPCYYFYKGGKKGVVGVTFKKELSESYLKGFILHEIMPGHHFYYLMRQYNIDNKIDVDHLHYIDTFYSPENTVNEGLAMNADLLLGNALDKETVAGVKLEKFVHKVLYNAWFAVHMNGEKDIKRYDDLLQDEIGFSAQASKQKLEYYIEIEKYYVPSYPMGTQYVQKIIQKLGLNNVHKLYAQHSVNTLDLLIQEESKCQGTNISR